MTEEQTVATEGEALEERAPRWFIDVDWLEARNRSFAAMARNALCPECRKRLATAGRDSSADNVVEAIRSDCSHQPGYINSELPILESAFRLFLANGNEALDLIDLGRHLSERRGIDTYRTSVEMLSRLLKSEDYYGLRQAPD